MLISQLKTEKLFLKLINPDVISVTKLGNILVQK